MLNFFLKIFLILLLYACSDKSLVISEDRNEVFPNDQILTIDVDAANENFDLGTEINNFSFTHVVFGI